MSFGELLVIALVALIVVKPQDLPALLKQMGRYLRAIQNTLSEAKNSINVLIDNDDLKSIRKDISSTGFDHYVLGDDGKRYPAYSLDGIPDHSRKAPTASITENSGKNAETLPSNNL